MQLTRRVIFTTIERFYLRKASKMVLNSSFVRVMPFPIFVWSGLHVRMSHLASAPLKLTRFNSFVQPFSFSDKVSKCSSILNVNSAIIFSSLLILFENKLTKVIFFSTF
ncbi:hypothetical cytosolic protein [Streptococcus dysgalactiae subsp. equisimilis RE378]|nr:hypothetical cytosolic protein [Streptococcus dysgalactiae subsp. equisimilis RE378]